MKQEGSLFCWGNDFGAPSDVPDDYDHLSPRQVAADVDWVRVATGGLHTCGLASDGVIGCWGSNFLGQVGQPESTWLPTPTPVSPATSP